MTKFLSIIPETTDVFITHRPRFGIDDNVGRLRDREGCKELLLRVQQIALKLHLFGHTHQDAGRYQAGPTTFINLTTDECMRLVTVIHYDV